MKIEIEIINNKLSIEPYNLIDNSNSCEIDLNLNEIAKQFAKENGFELTEKQAIQACFDSFYGLKVDHEVTVILSMLGCSCNKLRIGREVSSSDISNLRKKIIKTLNILKFNVLKFKYKNFDIKTSVEI